MNGYVNEDNLYWSTPDTLSGTGVLILAGSSGGIPAGRARLFSRHGALALAMRWFGGTGQPPTPCEVPVEAFLDTVDVLARRCDRVAIVGSSFGAEAALVTASIHPRIDTVVALSPTSVVWSGYGSGRWSSHWTHQGTSLPAIPLDLQYWPKDEPPSFVDLYRRSLLTASPADREAATIPVERIGGHVITVAGGDDQVWPSLSFAQAIADRRQHHELPTTHISHPAAGHRITLPGETPDNAGQRMRRGGTAGADKELGQAAWTEIAGALKLTTNDDT